MTYLKIRPATVGDDQYRHDIRTTRVWSRLLGVEHTAFEAVEFPTLVGLADRRGSAANIRDVGEKHGHRVVRMCGGIVRLTGSGWLVAR